METGQPKFRRRKADRPAEILEAALDVFAEKGFAAARLDEIAARAGVSKGAIYLYFETKDDIFRAVVARSIGADVAALRALLASHSGPFPDLLRSVGVVAGALAASPRLGAVLKMVVGEARNFPALARIWHDTLVGPGLEAMAAAYAAAQARGEIRSGDPHIMALQTIAPLLATVLHRETFTAVGATPFDPRAVLDQHIETLIRGLTPGDAR